MTDARELRPSGWSRFFDSGFLLLWLAFWIVGETVAFVLLGGLLWQVMRALVGSSLALPSGIPGSMAPAAILFLLLWLAFWTVGGLAAGYHLVRHLVGRDRIIISEEALHIETSAGPFTWRRAIPQAVIHRLRLRHANHAVVVDTPDGTLVVAELGTVNERKSLYAWMTSTLTLPDAAAVRRLEATTTPHGRLVRSEGNDLIVYALSEEARRRWAWAMASIAGVIALTWFTARARNAPVGVEDCITGALVAVLALLALFIARYERVWLIGRGRLQRRWMWGRFARYERAFDNDARLEMDYTRDSDGDDRYRLMITDGQRRTVLASALNEPYELLTLGAWLSARTEFSFTRMEGSSGATRSAH